MAGRLQHRATSQIPGLFSPIKYAELKSRQAALSTPASGNPLQIEAQPVVDKAEDAEKQIIFENSN